MLRNLNLTSGGRRILGVPAVGILASTIASQTSTGDNGPGLLYDESIAGANAGKQLRCRITSWPSAGALFVYENGAIDFTGAPNGTYTVGYNAYADDVFIGSDTATITVGTAGTSLTGVTSTFSSGNVAPAFSQAITGQAFSFAMGSLTPSVSSPGNVSLAGQTTTWQQGSVGVSGAATISGTALSFAQGTLTAVIGANVTLTGQPFAVSQGTVGVGVNKVLTGAQVALLLGQMSPSGGLVQAPKARSRYAVSYTQSTAVLTTGVAITCKPVNKKN